MPMLGVMAVLGSILALLTATLITRILLGAGLAMIAYSQVSGWVDSVIFEFEQQISGMPADVMAILARMGIGQALDVIISVAIGVSSVALAGRIVGLKVAS